MKTKSKDEILTRNYDIARKKNETPPLPLLAKKFIFLSMDEFALQFFNDSERANYYEDKIDALKRIIDSKSQELSSLEALFSDSALKQESAEYGRKLISGHVAWLQPQVGDKSESYFEGAKIIRDKIFAELKKL